MKIAIITNTCYEAIVPVLPKLRDLGHEISFVSLLSQKGSGKGIFFEKNFLWENEKPGIIKNINKKGYIDEYLNEYTIGILTHAVLFKNFAFVKPVNWIVIYKIIRYLKNEKFDVIHFNAESLLFFIIPFFIRNTKYIFTIHDPRPHTGEDSLTSKIIRRLIKKRKNVKYILPSKFSKQDFKTRFQNIPEDNIYFIPFGPHEWMTKYKIKNKKIANSILYFGRISPYKGIEYLLKAIQNLINNKYDLKVTIAGAGNFYLPIQEFKNHKNINIINRYISNSELAELIYSHSIIVCPYTDATQSGVIQTAYAFNKPIIATNVGALPEMVVNGVTGLIVPAKDWESLGKAIIKLLFNEKELIRLSTNIKIMNKESLSWDHIATKLIKVYYD